MCVCVYVCVYVCVCLNIFFIDRSIYFYFYYISKDIWVSIGNQIRDRFTQALQIHSRLVADSWSRHKFTYS